MKLTIICFLPSFLKRITISEIRQHPWFWKNMPREIVEAQRKGYNEIQIDQLPSQQSVEDIMRIVGEARISGMDNNGGISSLGVNVVEWIEEEVDGSDDFVQVQLT